MYGICPPGRPCLWATNDDDGDDGGGDGDDGDGDGDDNGDDDDDDDEDYGDPQNLDIYGICPPCRPCLWPTNGGMRPDWQI